MAIEKKISGLVCKLMRKTACWDLVAGGLTGALFGSIAMRLGFNPR